MIGVDVSKVEAWCQDALTLLPTPELPASFAEQRRATVRRHSGTKLLYKIAEDLAEGLSELPLRERDVANQLLHEKYGFGYELFTEKKLKRLREVLRRGQIKSDDEFREISTLASDTETDAELRRLMDKLLLDYEVGRTRSRKASVVAIQTKEDVDN